MQHSFTPLKFLILMFAGWISRRQLDVIEYLREENRVLKERLGGRNREPPSAAGCRLCRRPVGQAPCSPRRDAQLLLSSSRLTCFEPVSGQNDYAQGVVEGTAVLPAGWRDRLVQVSNPNTCGITGLCLDVHDLAISKYLAGREKDLEFTRELAKHRMTDKATLQARLRETKVVDLLRTVVVGRIERDFLGRATARGSRSRK